MSSDAFSLGMLKAGIPERTIKEWCVDPQVVIGGGGDCGNIFDQLEDLDTKPCFEKIQTLFQLQPASEEVKASLNSAFVFIKPHAVTNQTKALVEEQLAAKKISIFSQGTLSAEVIDKKQLIDNHYYAIASKATILKPTELNVPADKFKDKFGVEWQGALASGKVLNAMDACKELGVDAEELDALWVKTKKAGKLVKFGGGFYCGLVEVDGKDPIYAFNGFFMAMRSKFTRPGISIYYYVVQWDSSAMSWADFRGKFLGPTDPSDAPKGLFARAYFYRLGCTWTGKCPQCWRQWCACFGFLLQGFCRTP